MQIWTRFPPNSETKVSCAASSHSRQNSFKLPANDDLLHRCSMPKSCSAFSKTEYLTKGYLLKVFAEDFAKISQCFKCDFQRNCIC